MIETYRDGREAFGKGQPNSDNPHPPGSMNNDRVQWFRGWYDAKFAAKYPHLFGLKQ